ncbi:quinoprotein amine dehydrogenase beta chain-like protein, partial [Metarhizium brunneum ARSEF 3297]
MKFHTLLALSSTYLASHAASSALPITEQASCSSQSSGSSNARVIHQFPNGTWLENIAERRNGNLLVTLLDRPELYQVDPHNPANATLVHNFAGYTSLFGITETSPDVFAIIAGNFTPGAGTQEGTYAIWSTDFAGCKGAEVSKIVDIPEAKLLNGMTTLDANTGEVLVSDSGRGLVLRVDTKSGEYTTVLENDVFQPAPTAPIQLGINGIRLLGDHLYYTNTYASVYGRVAINPATGEAAGPFETISTDVMGDDFALDNQGNAYIAANPENEAVRVDRDGDAEVLAGNLNSTLVPGPTAAWLGKAQDRDGKRVLYVVTSGGQAGPINGTYTEGGKILALDV